MATLVVGKNAFCSFKEKHFDNLIPNSFFMFDLNKWNFYLVYFRIWWFVIRLAVCVCGLVVCVCCVVVVVVCFSEGVCVFVFVGNEHCDWPADRHTAAPQSSCFPTLLQKMWWICRVWWVFLLVWWVFLKRGEFFWCGEYNWNSPKCRYPKYVLYYHKPIYNPWRINWCVSTISIFHLH